MVEVTVQSCIPHLVERSKLPMLDDRANIIVAYEPSELLVVISLITGQDPDGLRVPLHYLRCNLRIVFSCRRYVNVENGISRCIDQQRRLSTAGW